MFIDVGTLIGKNFGNKSFGNILLLYIVIKINEDFFFIVFLSGYILPYLYLNKMAVVFIYRKLECLSTP